MKNKADKMVNFRVNADVWDKFTAIAKTRGESASEYLKDLILEAIEFSAISENVNTSVKQDVKQDVESVIAESLRGGDIKDALDTHYASMAAQLNSVLDYFYAMQSRLTDAEMRLNKLIPSAPQEVPNAEISTEELHPIDKLGLRAIAEGLPYTQKILLDLGIYQIIDDNRYLLTREGIKFRHESVGMVRDILTHFGYQVATMQFEGIRYKQVKQVRKDKV